MTIENYGYYVLALAVVTILSVPTSLGLPNLLVRYVSKYQVENKWGEIKGLLRLANKLVFFSFFIVFLISVILYFFWWNVYSDVLKDAIWVGFGILIFSGLSAIRAAALRGLHYIVLGQLPDTLLKNFLIFIGVLTYFYLDLKITPMIAIIIYFIAVVISYFVGFLLLNKLLLVKLKNVTTISENKFWIREALPFTINGSVQVIRSKLVTFILAAFGSVESVAIYDIALRGGALVSFTLDAMNTAIAPHISSSYQKGDKIVLQNILTKSSRIVFLTAIPTTLIFVFGGSFVISTLFGEEYINSYIPLVIICLGQLLSSTIGPVGIVLSMTGNMSYFTRNNIYVTIFNVLFSFPFIYFWDVEGAAILYSLLLIIQNCMLFIYLKKKLNINSSILNY